MGTKEKLNLDELEKRLKHIETLLEGVNTAEERWSLGEIQEIIESTDLTPKMDNLPLLDIPGQLEKISNSLNLVEDNILNLQMSHRGHTNYNPVEFANMHGYRIESLKKPFSLADSQPVSEHSVSDTLQSLRSELERCRKALAEVYSTECAQCGKKKPVTVKVRELGIEKLVCIKCLKEIW